MKMLLVSRHCPYCDSIKNRLRRTGLINKVKIVDVDTREGAAIADSYGVMHIPECVVIDEAGKARRCNAKEFDKLISEGV